MLNQTPDLVIQQLNELIEQEIDLSQTKFEVDINGKSNDNLLYILLDLPINFDDEIAPIIKRLLEKNRLNVNAIILNPYGSEYSLIQYAIRNRNVETFKVLLEYGANLSPVDKGSDQGQTLLHLAMVKHGFDVGPHPRTVQALIDAKMDVNSLDQNGLSPLAYLVNLTNRKKLCGDCFFYEDLRETVIILLAADAKFDEIQGDSKIISKLRTDLTTKWKRNDSFCSRLKTFSVDNDQQTFINSLIELIQSNMYLPFFEIIRSWLTNLRPVDPFPILFKHEDSPENKSEIHNLFNNEQTFINSFIERIQTNMYLPLCEMINS